MSDGSREIIGLYKTSEDTLIRLPSGEVEHYDLVEFYEVVDFFADRYGLGSCKTIEEFADMIDKTDPVILNVLRVVAVRRENEKWGGGANADKKPSGPMPRAHGGKKFSKGRFGNKFGPVEQPPMGNDLFAGQQKDARGAVGLAKMRQFLTDWGVPKEQLQQAAARTSERKIELKDFSHIDSYALKNMSPEKFRHTMAEMKEQNASCQNFNVSIDTIRGRK